MKWALKFVGALPLKTLLTVGWLIVWMAGESNIGDIKELWRSE
jgi:hypothetical protein